MNKTSIKILEYFVKEYVLEGYLKFLDVGSRVVVGQEEHSYYRDLFIRHGGTYIGLDVVEGNNVDVVSEPYNYPFEDDFFDVVVSSNTIEHVEYPWVLFREMSRILKVGGFLCVIAPAKWHEHKYPIDTFRYYPDGMVALAKWAGLEVLEVKRVVSDKSHEELTYLISRRSQGE